MWIRSFFLIFYGLCAGGLIAASFLAFLSMLGVIPRLAGLTKSMKTPECMKVLWHLEGFLGHWYLFIDGRSSWIPASCTVWIVWRDLCGMYDRSLAETIKSLPIFSRRLNLRSGIPYVIYGIAFGKMLGCWLYFYIFS